MCVYMFIYEEDFHKPHLNTTHVHTSSYHTLSYSYRNHAIIFIYITKIILGVILSMKMCIVDAKSHTIAYTSTPIKAS